MRSATARALEVLREEGVRALADRTLSQLGVHRLLVLERKLDALVAPLAAAVDELGLSLGEASVADLDPLAALRMSSGPPGEPPARPRAELDAQHRDQLQDGDRCFVARIGTRITAMTWVARGQVRVPYLRGDLLLAPDDAYVYDVFVAPDLRNRGVARALYAHVAACVAPSGAARLVMLVRVHNAANLRAAAHAGWRQAGTLACIVGQKRDVHLGDALKVRPWPRG